MNPLRIALLFSAFIPALWSPAEAALSAQEEKGALELSGSAIGKEVGDYTLIDQDGKKFRLREFAAGKPLIISLIYTSCGHICPTITMNLKNAFQKADKDLGVKFNAITVGFDVENDTPQRMKQYGGNFTNAFNSWRFATADKLTIEKLAKDIGFYYKKVTGGFDHLNAVTIIDAKGRIYRHVYGLDFKPEDILGPVYQAAAEKLDYKQSSGHEGGGIIDRIILFCYKYDEKTGQYKLDYSFLIGTVAEAITILSVIIFIWGKEIKLFFLRRLGR
ncbi:MAG: SCO family protein [Deltaproteobacteria bacterium]|nr:SCO family protein [Deltaproteobacteria bacterium]